MLALLICINHNNLAENVRGRVLEKNCWVKKGYENVTKAGRRGAPHFLWVRKGATWHVTNCSNAEVDTTVSGFFCPSAI